MNRTYHFDKVREVDGDGKYWALTLKDGKVPIVTFQNYRRLCLQPLIPMWIEGFSIPQITARYEQLMMEAKRNDPDRPTERN